MSETLSIDSDLLEAILAASYSTYMAHRGSKEEMFALGSLEATANLVYVLACDSSDQSLATSAQTFAGVALERSAEIFSQGGYYIDHSSEKLAAKN